MTTGLYWIRNTVEFGIYIGRSRDIENRWRVHLSQLRDGVHHSRRLQRDWDRHGEIAFEFLIIQVTEDGRKPFWGWEMEWMGRVGSLGPHGYNTRCPRLRPPPRPNGRAGRSCSGHAEYCGAYAHRG